MQKLCSCGQSMEIRLRTVVYLNSVEIESVPIYSCDSCHSCEVFPEVKSQLKELIHSLGEAPEKQRVLFSEISEFAYLLKKVSKQEHFQESLTELAEERVNELLDLLLLAQSLKENEWMDDLRSRLAQITKQIATNA